MTSGIPLGTIDLLFVQHWVMGRVKHESQCEGGHNDHPQQHMSLTWKVFLFQALLMRLQLFILIMWLEPVDDCATTACQFIWLSFPIHYYWGNVVGLWQPPYSCHFELEALSSKSSFCLQDAAAAAWDLMEIDYGSTCPCIGVTAHSCSPRWPSSIVYHKLSTLFSFVWFWWKVQIYFLLPHSKQFPFDQSITGLFLHNCLLDAFSVWAMEYTVCHRCWVSLYIVNSLCWFRLLNLPAQLLTFFYRNLG